MLELLENFVIIVSKIISFEKYELMCCNNFSDPRRPSSRVSTAKSRGTPCTLIYYCSLLERFLKEQINSEDV